MPVDDVRELFGRRDDLDAARGDVEGHAQVRLLLCAAADASERLLTDDRNDGLMVELGVVEPVQQVNRSQIARRDADANGAGELAVRRRIRPAGSVAT
jgi:hypothetical protein